MRPPSDKQVFEIIFIKQFNLAGEQRIPYESIDRYKLQLYNSHRHSGQQEMGNQVGKSDGCLELIGGAFCSAGVLVGTGMSLIGDLPHAGRFVGSSLAVFGLLIALVPHMLAQEGPWAKLMAFGAIPFLGSVPLFFTLQGFSVPNKAAWLVAPIVLVLGLALSIFGLVMAVRQDKRAKPGR